MSAGPAHDLQAARTAERRAAARSARARLVLALGPATAIAGLAWAFAQPYRLTFLHPAGQGFWWLLSEPPLYVIVVGIVFRLVVAPGLVEDLER